MEKFSSSQIANYDFSKKNRGKLLAEITKYTLKNLGKDYKLPKGYKTQFIEFSNQSSTNVFGDENDKKIYFSFNLLNDKNKFANDVYSTIKEIRRLCEFKGTYSDLHPIDKISPIFVSTDDMSKMISIEKMGNGGKSIESQNDDNIALKEQIEKDVECYMAGKNFLSPKEKQSRKFALDRLKDILNALMNEQNPSVQNLIDNIKKFIAEKEEEEKEKEEYFSQFIQNVEKDIIQTMKVAQKRLEEDVTTFAGYNSNVENYKFNYGYDPIKSSMQSLAITYDGTLAKNLFDACVIMDKNMPKYLNTCLDLIKYTDYTPSKTQIHSLNESCKGYNSTCENNNDKIHPKRELKKFFNIKTNSKAKQKTTSNEYSQQM